MEIVECVINISEGQNKLLINEIVSSALDLNVKLLHQDTGFDVNRTVLTLGGDITSIKEAAFNVIKICSERIDMKTHQGKHPCIGAADICPIIPLKNVSLSDCITASKELAKLVAERLSIPVFLYGESAELSKRKVPAFFRKGGIKELKRRMTDKTLRADFGPQLPHPSAGGIIIGARPLLIAYNINLSTKDVNQARKIALELRNNRDRSSSFPKDFQALGWFVKDFDCCQVSLNITDFRKTSLHEIFTATTTTAAQYGVEVTGSEIIGLVPEAALTNTGSSFLEERTDSSASDQKRIQAAVEGLKLSDLYPFSPENRILESQLRKCGFEI